MYKLIRFKKVGQSLRLAHFIKIDPVLFTAPLPPLPSNPDYFLQAHSMQPGH